MKILVVTNYLPPKIGGIERFSHELASALNANEGVKVSVATSDWPSNYVDADWKEIIYPYSVVVFPSITIFKRLPLPRIFHRSFWNAIRNLKQDFDLVFFQSHLFVLNWIILFRLRHAKRRVWMNHGCNYVRLNSKMVSFFSYIYERIGMAIMKTFCNEFAGQSRNAAIWISSKVGIQFQVFSNAINLKNFETECEIAERPVRTKLLFVGRLVEGKGLFECLWAVSKANDILIHNQDPQLFTLTIVGAGPLANRIQKRKWNVRIDIRGELSHREVIQSMYESDILIQAYSHSEGLSTVTLEGLATGLIIVTTPLSGNNNLDLCINYFSGNLGELPNLLLKSRALVQSRAELLTSGRTIIEAGLTWEIMARRLINRDYSIF